MYISTKKVKLVKYVRGLTFTAQFLPHFRIGSPWTYKTKPHLYL